MYTIEQTKTVNLNPRNAIKLPYEVPHTRSVLVNVHGNGPLNVFVLDPANAKDFPRHRQFFAQSRHQLTHMVRVWFPPWVAVQSEWVLVIENLTKNITSATYSVISTTYGF